MDAAPLVRAIASALMLLEHSEDDEINPDTAVRGMESIGRELIQITGAARVELLEVIERVAQSEQDPNAAEFIRRIPFMIGMAE